MKSLINFHNCAAHIIEARLAGWFLPSFARLSFAAVLLVYFWNAAMLKIGAGVFGFLNPTTSAYAQILPKRAEALGYDIDAFGLLDRLIVTAGTWAEFVLPALIILGLATRLAALGMIGFVFVQSLVDVTGHGADDKTIGAWFDNLSGSLILDQRLLWVLLLSILVVRGAGPISLDRAITGLK